ARRRRCDRRCQTRARTARRWRGPLDLAARVAEVRGRLEGVAQGAERADLRVGDLAGLPQQRAEAADRKAAFVDRLAGLLLEGGDVPVNDLPARVKTLAELGRLRSEAAGLCAGALPGRPSEQPESLDWLARHDVPPDAAGLAGGGVSHAQ